MHKTKFAAVILFELLGLVTVQASELTVHAAASLSDAMKEIGVAYEKASGDTVRFNFAASSLLARQIEEGAPADLFISADEAKMESLAQKNLLLPETRRILLSNSLVLIVPLESRVVVKGPTDLPSPEIKKIALGEPSTVPAGIYAREYLVKTGVWDGVKEKAVPLENVRAALAAVESGNVDAGMVYKTDALLSKKVKVAFAVPAADGPRISYPVAVLKGSKDIDHAKKFEEYLASRAAGSVFEKFGFVLAK